MIKGFSVKNWKNLKPLEDSYRIEKEEKIIAVADGVTRDPKGMPVLPSEKNYFGMLKFFLKYPRPSPAKIAADLFCKVFIDSMMDFYVRDKDAIYKSFKEANEAIRKLNLKKNSNPNYLENYFWSCVATGTSLWCGVLSCVLSYGFICDCGVCLFDEHGNLKFKTQNEGPNYTLTGVDWKSPDGRSRIRKYFRNNPENNLACGILTGEPEAMSYVRTGEIEMNPRDVLVVYTDGLEKIILSGEFSDNIRKKDFRAIRRLCKKNVETEGTLVYYMNK